MEHGARPLRKPDHDASGDVIPALHPEDMLASHQPFEEVGPTHKEIQDAYLPDNVIPLREFDKAVASRMRLMDRQKEDQLRVKFRDWASEHRTVTIVGSAAAITIALGGLYAIRKHRQK